MRVLISPPTCEEFYFDLPSIPRVGEHVLLRKGDDLKQYTVKWVRYNLIETDRYEVEIDVGE